MDREGVLRINKRLCVPNDLALRKKLMHEVHCSGYAMHPGETKTYQELKSAY